MKKILAIALVAVLMLSLLTACSGGNDTPSGGGNNNGGNSTPSGNNGGNNSTPSGNNNSGGSAENYPDYWNDEIPKMNGKVTYSMELGENNLSLFIDVKDKGVIDDYIKALENDGYEKHIDKSDDTHRDVALKNGKWNVHINYNHADGDKDLSVKLNHSPDVGYNGGSNNGGDNSGEAIGYPAEWQDAIPKMSGTVSISFPMAEKPQDGYQVILDNKTIDDVMGYVEVLKNDGYTFNANKDVEVPFTSGGSYATTYRNGTWAVGISFTDSTKQAAIYFLKDE